MVTPAETDKAYTPIEHRNLLDTQPVYFLIEDARQGYESRTERQIPIK